MRVHQKGTHIAKCGGTLLPLSSNETFRDATADKLIESRGSLERNSNLVDGAQTVILTNQHTYTLSTIIRL